MTGQSTLIIVPTYDEIDNIESLIGRIHAVLPDAHVLVVDDKSPDGTADAVARMGDIDDRVKLMRRPGKLGLGTAYLAGFAYALERGYERVFEMDADFSHDPKYLPAFLAAAEDADLVIGSRYVAGGGVENWPLYRRLVSLGGSLYSRLILGVPIRDLTGGFKCFRRQTLVDLPLDEVKSEGYSFQIEMNYRVYKQGKTIREIPIVFADRVGGVSKMSWAIFLEAIIRVWQIRFTV
jgi:dolichol-phosphate mannosyltransferase